MKRNVKGTVKINADNLGTIRELKDFLDIPRKCQWVTNLDCDRLWRHSVKEEVTFSGNTYTSEYKFTSLDYLDNVTFQEFLKHYYEYAKRVIKPHLNFELLEEQRFSLNFHYTEQIEDGPIQKHQVILSHEQNGANTKIQILY